MKRTLLVTLIAVLIGSWASVGLANGQATTCPGTGVTGGGHHRGMMKALFEKLNLTDDQKTKIKAIFQKAHADAKAAADKATKHQIYKAAFQDAKKVLTAEQLAKLQELRKEHRQARAAAASTK